MKLHRASTDEREGEREGERERFETAESIDGCVCVCVRERERESE